MTGMQRKHIKFDNHAESRSFLKKSFIFSFFCRKMPNYKQHGKEQLISLLESSQTECQGLREKNASLIDEVTKLRAELHGTLSLDEVKATLDEAGIKEGINPIHIHPSKDLPKVRDTDKSIAEIFVEYGIAKEYSKCKGEADFIDATAPYLPKSLAAQRTSLHLPLFPLG